MPTARLYEQDFYPCAYRFRPGRSAHQALHSLRRDLWVKRLYWLINIDIRKYFDSIPHTHLTAFLDQRVMDGVVRRMIDKWLHAGALEDGLLRRTTMGSPQGGVVSPCLSNILLHHVLDEWFETKVRPRLHGECTLARYADDAVMAFETIIDANRVMAILGRRLGRYAPTLHPDKTRLVDFRPRRTESTRHPTTHGTNFDFLGLTHVWGRSRNGKDMVLQLTAKSRFARALATVSDWCRTNRHQSIPEQHLHLSSMMRGHFAYFALAGMASDYDGSRIKSCGYGRSGCRGEIAKALSDGLASTNPEAPSLAAAQNRPSVRHREPISTMRNRMREICTSGSARDGAGNDPIYSAQVFDWVEFGRFGSERPGNVFCVSGISGETSVRSYSFVTEHSFGTVRNHQWR